jgi:hypothetical protein
MHIIHYAILGNHLHLIVECDEVDSLERGMRGLNTRIAKRLNKVFGRRGKLVDGRYHARELGTPLEIRNALRYVFFNHAKHEAKAGRRRASAVVDPCSSAARFDGWRMPPENRNATKDFGTSPARTWLLRTGWKRHGLLDLDERPHERPPPTQA